MDLRFERGKKESPTGHAFIFFRAAGGQAGTLATYVIVLPIQLDIAKYMPPMLSGSMPGMGMIAPTVVPMPPIPEPVEDRVLLERLAEARGDDVIDGGMIYDTAPEHMLNVVGQIATQYEILYTAYVESFTRVAPAVEAPKIEHSYSHLSEAEKVAELAKLAGQLRYAVEAGDSYLQQDSEDRMQLIANSLPSRYRVPDLVEAAKTPGESGRKLTELQIQRCYKLQAEAYNELAEIESQITELKSDLGT